VVFVSRAERSLQLHRAGVDGLEKLFIDRVRDSARSRRARVSSFHPVRAMEGAAEILLVVKVSPGSCFSFTRQAHQARHCPNAAPDQHCVGKGSCVFPELRQQRGAWRRDPDSSRQLFGRSARGLASSGTFELAAAAAHVTIPVAEASPVYLDQRRLIIRATRGTSAFSNSS